MDPRLSRLLASPDAPPGASYLGYLYAVQQNDYTAALDHLHRSVLRPVLLRQPSRALHSLPAVHPAARLLGSRDGAPRYLDFGRTLRGDAREMPVRRRAGAPPAVQRRSRSS